jgi:two-component system chemotaxis response regulator CheB
MKTSIQARDWETLFELAESLTSQSYTLNQKSGILKNNLIRRMRDLQMAHDPALYLRHLEANESELSHFLSACTIHTTSWFREWPHFERLKEYLVTHRERLLGRPFRMLCTACSTGQEPYSFACILEAFRLANPGFEYHIDAFDIDAISVGEAQRAIYKWPIDSKDFNVKQPFIKVGRNNAAGFFTFSKDVRSRMRFFTASIAELPTDLAPNYDWISCRNVLIYFEPKQISAIVQKLAAKLEREHGLLALGHSDNLDAKAIGLQLTTAALYRIPAAVATKRKTTPKVLIIDDSQVVRKRLAQIFKDNGYTTVDVESAYAADQALEKDDFDLVTLDLQMPGENGLDWARRVRRRSFKAPIIMVSDSTPEDAPQILDLLGKEIQEFCDKKTLHSQPAALVERCAALLEERQPAPALSTEARAKRTGPSVCPDLILIGASTGGTNALTDLLKSFPKPTPPIVIVQHITPNFAKPFSERLAVIAGLKLGSPGTTLEKDHIYMAAGDEHIRLVNRAGQTLTEPSSAAPRSRHRPSVDVLFESALQLRGRNFLAVLMTGMGADGATGLLGLRKNGAFTACQDQASCVVFGMPKEAIRMGAAEYIGNIADIRRVLEEAIRIPARRETTRPNPPKTQAKSAS